MGVSQYASPTESYIFLLVLIPKRILKCRCVAVSKSNRVIYILTSVLTSGLLLPPIERSITSVRAIHTMTYTAADIDR